jgi:hypothetical protein
MPFIAFDLDALAKCSNIARAGKCGEDSVVAGFVRLWEHCWRTKTDRITRFQLVGVFGNDVADALTEFGFLEFIEAERAYRVRGSDRYLRLRESRSAGGHASKQNLIPGGKKKKGKVADNSSAPAEPEPSASRAPAEEKPVRSSALPSSIEHRASISTLPSEECAEPAPVQQKGKPEKETDGRSQPLTESLTTAFRELRGEKYLFSREKDPPAIKDLLKNYEPPLILERWREGLCRTSYPTCDTIAELRQIFNKLGKQQSLPLVRQKRVPAEDNNHSETDIARDYREF